METQYPMFLYHILETQEPYIIGFLKTKQNVKQL